MEKEERGKNSKRKLDKDFGNAIITRMCVLENFKHFNLFFSEIKKKITPKTKKQMIFKNRYIQMENMYF